MGSRGPQPAPEYVLKKRGSLTQKYASKPRQEVSVYVPTRKPAVTGLKRLISTKIPGFDPYLLAKGFKFDEKRAARAVQWIQEELHHSKGPLARHPLILRPWQKAFCANLFGWVDKKGNRRFREALLYVPRKNGKTTLCAAIITYLLFNDPDEGKEIYGAASEYGQASLVFEHCRSFVELNPELYKLCHIFKGQSARAIQLYDDYSTYRVVSAEGDTKHGYNINCAIVDELHTQKDRRLLDVLETGVGSRDNPLMVYLTTADYEREGSPCNEKHDYARGVLSGDITDPHFLPAIWEAPKDADWESEATWKAANPNYGVSIRKDYFKRMAKRARDVPSFRNTFKRFHLNIRTDSADAYLDMAHWRACGRGVDYESLRGRKCYGGLDLSSTRDITAYVLAFPEQDYITLVPYLWLPKATIAIREDYDKVPYSAWVEQGFIEVTPGNTIDYSWVRKRIVDSRDQYDLQGIAFDPYNCTHLAQELENDDGIDMFLNQQSIPKLNEPTKRLEALVLNDGVNHEDNKVFNWMMGNMTVYEDSGGNVRPDKKRSGEKIDGAVAAIMAINLWMLKDAQSGSVYDAGEVKEV